nr:ribonuclease H-like domain-containing protein [Tanacetum cinerariifolium]
KVEARQTVQVVVKILTSSGLLLIRLNERYSKMHDVVHDVVLSIASEASFVDSRFPHHVCRLHQCLYGLKQAPRTWFQRFAGYALPMVFTRVDVTRLFLFVGMVLSLAGGLHYLTFTRPDISYAVQHICLHMHDPREPHLTALKRVLRYVCGTLDFGLQLYASPTYSLVAYSDADRARCPTTRQSTSGYCMFFGDNLLSWSSKRQHTLSRSSAEAKYRGVANVVAETA